MHVQKIAREGGGGEEEEASPVHKHCLSSGRRTIVLKAVGAGVYMRRMIDDAIKYDVVVSVPGACLDVLRACATRLS